MSDIRFYLGGSRRECPARNVPILVRCLPRVSPGAGRLRRARLARDTRCTGAEPRWPWFAECVALLGRFATRRQRPSQKYFCPISVALAAVPRQNVHAFAECPTAIRVGAAFVCHGTLSISVRRKESRARLVSLERYRRAFSLALGLPPLGPRPVTAPSFEGCACSELGSYGILRAFFYCLHAPSLTVNSVVNQSFKSGLLAIRLCCLWVKLLGALLCGASRETCEPKRRRTRRRDSEHLSVFVAVCAYKSMVHQLAQRVSLYLFEVPSVTYGR